MDAYIRTIEYYLPDNVLTNEELASIFPEWDAEKVSRKTGIIRRHLSSKEETATDMAYHAANKLFDKNPQLKESVDFLLLCTQSADYKLPTSACILQERLGLPTSVGALDYNLGCSGYVYGLALAKGLLCSHIASNVLLLTSETYSKYLHPKDKGCMSIFADGAAATVVSKDGFAQIGEFVMGTDGKGKDNLIVKTGGSRFPKPLYNECRDVNGYFLASDYLYMNGPEIFNFTLDAVPNLLKECIIKNNKSNDDIDCYVLHQANQYMLDTIRKVCGISKEKFYVKLEDVGNTVSASIPIALKNAIEERFIRKDHHVITAGFGVGYSYGACLLKF